MGYKTKPIEPVVGRGFRDRGKIERAAQDYESVMDGFQRYIGLEEGEQAGGRETVPIRPIQSDKVGGITVIDPYLNSLTGLNKQIADKGSEEDIRKNLWHELVHAQTASLNKYAESEQEAQLIAEMLAEYALPKYLEEEAGMEELANYFRERRPPRPLYEGAYRLGAMTDLFYESELDNGKGLEAFIRDIQTKGSIGDALERWKECKEGFEMEPERVIDRLEIGRVADRLGAGERYHSYPDYTLHYRIYGIEPVLN